MKIISSYAYPGLPVVFAEGYQDVSTRRSFHGHASFALTNLENDILTKTRIIESDDFAFTIDRGIIENSRSPGITRIVKEMIEMSDYVGELKIESFNQNITSGSSDSGSAALVVGLNEYLDLDMTIQQLCDMGRYMSETAYRSIIGGLSCYDISGNKVDETQLLDEDEFKDLCVFSVSFDIPRIPADIIHQKVVDHPGYEANSRLAERNLGKIRDCAREGDLQGILSIMQSDAKRAHQMFDEVGCNVIKPEMWELCSLVDELSTEFPIYWNVAGASVVYLFCFKENSDFVKIMLETNQLEYVRLKVAGPAGISL